MTVQSPPPGLHHFLAVAQCGSFRGAARQLGQSPAAVSKGVARLEAALGVALFARTTRSVGLTAEGRRFLPHAERALDALRAGRDELRTASAEVAGTVRLSLSPVLAPLLGVVWARALDRHPRLRVALDCTDDRARLTDDSVDIAVRIGILHDSALIARPLGRLHWATVASPSYLAAWGTPTAPGELEHHRCLAYVGPGGQTVGLRLRGAPAARPPALSATDGRALVDAALAGVGIAQVFRFLAAPHLELGRLVSVLDDHTLPGLPVHALVRAERRRLPRVAAVLGVLRDVLGPAA